MFFSGTVVFAQAETLVASVEAESGSLTGVNVASSTGGFSGSGYVTGFNNTQDKVTVTVNVAEKGFYKLVIRYNSSSGDKTQDMIINNGGVTQVLFPKSIGFTDLNVGKYTFEKGTNTITIQSSWGWMDVDKFSIYTTSKNVYNITQNLVDANANVATIALYTFLYNHFGKKIIAGQTNSYYAQLKTLSGKEPLLRAWDFQSYTEGYSYLWVNGAHTFGAVDNGNTQAAINWYNATGKKGIVSFQWHWHSPTGGSAGTNTFYTDKTTFDVTKAVQTGTQENTYIIRDIDAIAVQLKKLESAGVPVLWRPLHEAGGAWFWWGAKGSVACKQLFDIVFDRLKNFHNIHNLIWVWSTPEADWYPGNDKIDIVGYDSYPGAYNYTTQKNAFDRLYAICNGQKIMAMTENGPIPDPNDCLTLDAPWSYFMSWSDLVTAQNTNAHIVEVLTNPNVLCIGYVEDPASNPTVRISSPNLYSVFPNPSKNEIQIIGSDIKQLELISPNGKVVFSSQTPVYTIQTQSFKAGVYILKIYNTKGIYTQKVIIRE